MVAMLVLLAVPAQAQVTVLDRAQDAGGQDRPCGAQPLSIARMSWPSATLLAEIHARILQAEFGCDVQLTPGDLAATASSMGSTGQPAVAPELWINRIADVWNGAMDAQMVRSAAPTYAEAAFEGWYMPADMSAGFSEPPSASGLAAVLPALQADGAPIRFISCPIDWACSVINRNLIAAHGLEDLVEIVEPDNRLDMDRLIAEAVNLRQPFLFYYWQPNAILAQLDFVALDMGAYDEAAAQCLGRRTCAQPTPSAFPEDLVVIALAERVFTDLPAIAGYFQRSAMPLAEMNALLAQLSVEGATPEAVADRFIAERRDLWADWLDAMP
jgi:glycine betaine/proline transport system substrate-binding protein